MSLTLTAGPEKTVNGVLSNANAGITQLPFTFKREDFVSDKILQQGVTGFIRSILNASEGDVTAQFPAGTVVYVSQTDYVGVYTVTGTTFSVNTSLILDGVYTVDNDFTGYVNNLTERSDYVVEIEFTFTSNVKILDDVFVYKPSQAGNLFIDFGAVVVTYMESKKIAFQLHRVQYRETWTGFQPAFTPTNNLLTLLGEKSIGEAGGSNLWEYLLRETLLTNLTTFAESSAGNLRVFSTLDVQINLLFPVGSYIELFNPSPYEAGIYRVVASAYTGTATSFDLATPFISVFDPQQASLKPVDDLGKFLTRFDEPKLWKGFSNQNISFIMDSNYNARNTSASYKVLQEGANINKGLTGTSTFISDANLNPRIIEYIIDETITGVDDVFMRLRVLTGEDDLISNFIFMPVKDACENPVMVEWVNSLGANEFYLFDITQQVRLSSSDGLIYDEPVTQDVENINRQTTRLSSDETLQLTLSAENLTKNDLRALHELKTSEAVNVWLTNDGLEKIGVVVSNIFETVFATEDATNTFNVEIAFPSDYDFFSIKKY